MENIYNIEFKRKLPIPQEIKKEMPLSKEAEELKTKRDAEIADIFCGRDDRFILIIGPCSADHADSVLDYIHRLGDVQKEVSDKILIIPRIYTGKPRTASPPGWRPGTTSSASVPARAISTINGRRREMARTCAASPYATRSAARSRRRSYPPIPSSP